MVNFSCSECNFTAQFESALIMHKQLHHGVPTDSDIQIREIKVPKEKSFTIPRTSFDSSSDEKEKTFKLPVRTSSATKLLGKLRAKICRSKTLFVHDEEADATSHVSLKPNNIAARGKKDLTVRNECTSKAFKPDSKITTLTPTREDKETYGCHMCSFDADRITALDRHLLNDHKIGLENILKLVLAKTKTGLSTDDASNLFGIRQPYYKPQDEIIEEGEFIIENVTPKIKILKHASTNTDLKLFEVPDLTKNCRMISEELEKFIKQPSQKTDSDEFLSKMQTLNDYMCKFFDSSNVLKKALNKEFDSKGSAKDELANDEGFDLGLAEQDTQRDWNRSQGDQMEKNRNIYGEKSRSEKSKFSADSFYF